jgi:hypothetical protein
MRRWLFAGWATLLFTIFAFGFFVWPTPWNYHYDRSRNVVVRLNRFTGYAERLPIHGPIKVQRTEGDEWLDRWLSRFETRTGGTLRDIEQDRDFQALFPGEQDNVRLVFLRQVVFPSADFRSLSPQEKSRIALRVMAIGEVPGMAQFFMQSIRETPLRWRSGP